MQTWCAIVIQKIEGALFAKNSKMAATTDWIAKCSANPIRYLASSIDKVYVAPEGDGALCPAVKIFTGDAAERYLQKLRRRTDIITTQSDRQAETPDSARGYALKDVRVTRSRR